MSYGVLVGGEGIQGQLKLSIENQSYQLIDTVEN